MKTPGNNFLLPASKLQQKEEKLKRCDECKPLSPIYYILSVMVQLCLPDFPKPVEIGKPVEENPPTRVYPAEFHILAKKQTYEFSSTLHLEAGLGSHCPRSQAWTG